MKTFVFVYHAQPTASSPEFGRVGGAHVDVWVPESSRENAEKRAVEHLIDLGWNPLELENELVMLEGQIQDYRIDAQASYYQAQREGISSTFAAYPPQDRDDDVMEIRELNAPPDMKPEH